MKKAQISQMDSPPTPLPGKTRPSKNMNYPKAADEPKANLIEDPNQKKKRIFGTQRSTNVPVKFKAEKKPMGKGQVEKKQPEAVRKLTPKMADKESKVDEIMEKRKERKPEPMKDEEMKKAQGDDESKKPTRRRRLGDLKQKRQRWLKDQSSLKRQTRLRERKPKPQRRLESSSYWTGQIKEAESVGKHFVSAAFFKLAYDCNTEPVRSLKIELKRYLSRHGHLGKEEGWIEASRNYGILQKDAGMSSGKRGDQQKAEDTNAISENDGQMGLKTA